jgi:hypothetical protein
VKCQGRIARGTAAVLAAVLLLAAAPLHGHAFGSSSSASVQVDHSRGPLDDAQPCPLCRATSQARFALHEPGRALPPPAPARSLLVVSAQPAAPRSPARCAPPRAPPTTLSVLGA